MFRIRGFLGGKRKVKFIVRDKFSDVGSVVEVKGDRWINRLFNLFGLQYKFLPVSCKIIKEAKRFNPDVISLNQIEGGYFQTRDLIKLSKIAPVVWTMHDLWAFMGNAHRELPQGESERKIYPQIGLPLGGWLLKQKWIIYQKADFRVVCPSTWLFHKKLDSICDKAGYIIPHGIDLDKFNPKKVKRMLFVAEKTSKGNLRPILERLDLLLREKVLLTVIGEGGINEAYKNIIIENKGYIEDEEELIFYYRDADVFIYPVVADIFGLVVLESIACGTPVVAYGVGALGELIGSDGFLIKYGAYADFAFKIYALLMNEKLHKTMSEKARQQAMKFDIKEIVKQYEKVYEDSSNSVRL